MNLRGSCGLQVGLSPSPRLPGLGNQLLESTRARVRKILTYDWTSSHPVIAHVIYRLPTNAVICVRNHTTLILSLVTPDNKVIRDWRRMESS